MSSMKCVIGGGTMQLQESRGGARAFFFYTHHLALHFQIEPVATTTTLHPSLSPPSPVDKMASSIPTVSARTTVQAHWKWGFHKPKEGSTQDIYIYITLEEEESHPRFRRLFAHMRTDIAAKLVEEEKLREEEEKKRKAKEERKRKSEEKRKQEKEKENVPRASTRLQEKNQTTTTKG
ncbi:hypothetical protein C8R43DRAFT_948688 [Mycena crocata]|nr:hypothetical protein C8R43DRAFT_948688 [Mycena crocata]